MSVRGPARGAVYGVDDIRNFDALIDARTPAEFALDHIPGAINCPVLDNEQRRIVGTLYKEQGAFEARRVGGAMVAENLARHLRGALAQAPANWRPLVYCWRGGLRSASMVAWMRLVGWDAQQLSGGYKRWRRHVIDTIERLCPALPLRVLCGATGSAKTRILHALAAQGAQVLDLEALALHKGSVLGALPGKAQPSQKAFETALAHGIAALDTTRPIYIEAESRKIGALALPTALLERLRASPCIEIVAGAPARLAYLLRDYAYLGDDPEGLARRLGTLDCAFHGPARLAHWQDLARSSLLAPLFAELMERHYDPLYARSQGAHFFHWPQRVLVRAERLDDSAFPKLARAILALALAPTPPVQTCPVRAEASGIE